MAKKHKLKNILSHKAIENAVKSIWKTCFYTKENEKWYDFVQKWNIPNRPQLLFITNALSDFMFFMLLSFMMLTGICNKARAQLLISRTHLLDRWAITWEYIIPKVEICIEIRVK